MCQYLYHYFSHCRHQEFTLFRFCERATTLETLKKAEVNEEAATNQPPARKWKSYSAAVKSTSPLMATSSQQVIHQQKPSIDMHNSRPSSSITMEGAIDTRSCRSMSTREATLRGGEVPSDDAVMRAELEAVTKRYHQLSAAVRLRNIHESTRSTSVDGDLDSDDASQLQAESFPALVAPSYTRRTHTALSYARVAQQPPTLATEKRATERQKRKSLPEGWMDQTFTETGSIRSPGRSQNARYDTGTLKSSPSRPTLSRATASKAPSYASPTAASKHRSTLSLDADKSPTSRNAKSVRLETATLRENKPLDPRSSQRLVAVPVFNSPTKKVFSTLGRRAAVVTPTFGMDGADDYVEAEVLHESSGNVARRSGKTDRLHLKISIPERAIDLARSVSPSRIPVPTYAPSRSATASISHRSGSESEHSPLDAAFAQTVEHLQNEHDNCKSFGRASILEPIRRRLSIASSRSRSESGASTTEPERFRASGHAREATDIDVRSQTDASSQADDTITESAVYSKAEPSPSTSAPLSSDAAKPASIRLLNTIKQTARDYAERYSGAGVPEKSNGPHLVLKDIQQPEKPPAPPVNHHSRTVSVASSPEQDPAVVQCSPPKTEASMVADMIQMRLEGGSKGSSLRATAPDFVPVPAREVFAPAARPETPMEEISPQISPQHTEVSDLTPGWMPPEQWFALPDHERAYIAKQRRQRGSSSGSSTGISSMTFGPVFSPTRVPGMGMENERPYWDWFTSCRTGTDPPVRFGRAPLPTMSEDDDVNGNRKGWGIGSAAPGWWYGWRGGDGLEISFTGHGPSAEKNPSAPVNFRDFDRGSCDKDISMPINTPQRHGYPSSNNNSSSGSTPTAPRRVREWARTMGYPAAPCGNFEVVQAVEHIGVPATRGSVNGWCHDCWPPHC